jgi:hypothetical protein
MTIDTKVRHITKPGASLFLELGFSGAEAKDLLAASSEQINDTAAQADSSRPSYRTGSSHISVAKPTRRKS